MNVGFIGSSAISDFHLSTMNNNGFKVGAIGTRKNSESCMAFAKKNNLINEYCSNGWEEVIDKDLDAYIVCVNIKSNFEILKKCLEKNKPTFVEKPVDFELSKMKNLCEHKNAKNIFVGYNRRFYDSILELKYLCEKSFGGTVVANIPDSICGVKQFIQNGCHIIDILRYCCGDFEILSKTVEVNKEKNDLNSISALCKNNKWTILINAHSLIPANFSITVNSSNNVYELKPIENLNVYEGMEIIEPNPEIPIRKYVPKLKRSILENAKFKPGFDAMYKNFKLFIEKKESIYCSILDAKETLNICRSLIESKFQNNYLI